MKWVIISVITRFDLTYEELKPELTARPPINKHRFDLTYEELKPEIIELHPTEWRKF